MEFVFSPEFEFLAKLRNDLSKISMSEDEIIAISKYLGVNLSDTSVADRGNVLFQALLVKNSFLSVNLSSDSIYDSDEYRTSTFIREIVANNRMNLRNRSLRNG